MEKEPRQRKAGGAQRSRRRRRGRVRDRSLPVHAGGYGAWSAPQFAQHPRPGYIPSLAHAKKQAPPAQCQRGDPVAGEDGVFGGPLVTGTRRRPLPSLGCPADQAGVVSGAMRSEDCALLHAYMAEPSWQRMCVHTCGESPLSGELNAPKSGFLLILGPKKSPATSHGTRT